MDNRIKISTHFDADHIRQTMDMPNDLMGKVEQVIQLKDEGVRQALIELGWAPPEDREGMALVPRSITAESGHKAGMIGDFQERVTLHCDVCEGDGQSISEDGPCENCEGAGEYGLAVPVSWTTIKDIHRRIVEIAEEGE